MQAFNDRQTVLAEHEEAEKLRVGCIKGAAPRSPFPDPGLSCVQSRLMLRASWREGSARDAERGARGGRVRAANERAAARPLQVLPAVPPLPKQPSKR